MISRRGLGARGESRGLGASRRAVGGKLARRRCTFPPDYAGGSTTLFWSGRFSEIPPVLAARLRRGG
jgi:hypothetical protein